MRRSPAGRRCRGSSRSRDQPDAGARPRRRRRPPEAPGAGRLRRPAGAGSSRLAQPGVERSERPRAPGQTRSPWTRIPEARPGARGPRCGDDASPRLQRAGPSSAGCGCRLEEAASRTPRSTSSRSTGCGGRDQMRRSSRPMPGTSTAPPASACARSGSTVSARRPSACRAALERELADLSGLPALRRRMTAPAVARRSPTSRRPPSVCAGSCGARRCWSRTR